MRGPEVVAAVELEEDEEGEEKTRDPSYVCIHLKEGVHRGKYQDNESKVECT